MRMILIYNNYMTRQKIKINHKSKESVGKYVRDLTDNLDIMAEKMTKREFDADDYAQWLALICSALDLIREKSKIEN